MALEHRLENSGTMAQESLTPLIKEIDRVKSQLDGLKNTEKSTVANTGRTRSHRRMAAQAIPFYAVRISGIMKFC